MPLYRPTKYTVTTLTLSNQTPVTIGITKGVAGVRFFATVDTWVRIGSPMTILSMTGNVAFVLPAGRVETYAVGPDDEIRASSTSLADGSLLTTELGL